MLQVSTAEGSEAARCGVCRAYRYLIWQSGTVLESATPLLQSGNLFLGIRLSSSVWDCVGPYVLCNRLSCLRMRRTSRGGLPGASV